MNKSPLKFKIRYGMAGILLAAVYAPAALATVAPEPPTSVPEPGPFGLLLLGALALVVARRFLRNR